MTRPRLLDLYSGAGGAAAGYHRAGFDVVGVDINPMPRYPFEFHQADALEYLAEHGREFDAIHASPPCQAYTAAGRMHGTNHRHPDLVGPTREALTALGIPWVIENVVSAPLIDPIKLCGDMFDLGVQRHRLFESPHDLAAPRPCRKGHPMFTASVFGKTALSRTPPGGWQAEPGNYMQNRVHLSLDAARAAMGIEWMTWAELSESIPPAYTEHIGNQLRAAL